MLRMWLAELIAHFTGFAYAAGNKGAAIGGLHRLACTISD
jgi:hypothetical protein